MTSLLHTHRSLRGTAAEPSRLALGLVAAALVAPGAASAASWSAPGALPFSAEVGQPAVSASPDVPGAAATWVSDGRVFTSTIGGFGGWATPRPLSPVGTSGTPSLDVGTLGRVVVAWTQIDGGHQRVAVATRRLLGAWSPAVFVSPAGLDARQVKTVIGRGGTADLAWVQSGMSGVATVATATATVGLTTPTWRTGTLTSPGTFVSSLDLTVGRGGNDSVRAAWSDESGVRTAARPASGTWGATTSFEAGSDPQVAVDSRGRDTIPFTTDNGITAKRRASGTTWTSAPVPGGEQFRTDTAGQFVSDVSLDVRPDGAAQVYFVQLAYGGANSGYNVQRSSLPLTGQGSITTLSKNSQLRNASLVASVDDAGNDVAYWNAEDEELGELTLLSGGSLAGPTIPNLSFAPPKVDAAGNGNAIMAWSTNAGLGYTIRR